MSAFLAPVTLTGRHVRIEPLERRHAADLLAAGDDDEVWRWLAWARPRELAEMKAIVDVRGRLEDRLERHRSQD